MCKTHAAFAGLAKQPGGLPLLSREQLGAERDSPTRELWQPVDKHIGVEKLSQMQLLN